MRSLRARLVVAVCAAACVALASAGVATATLFSHSQLHQVDDSLQRTHEPLEQLVAAAGDEDPTPAARTTTTVDARDDDGDALSDAHSDLERSIEQLAPGVLVMVIRPNGELEVSLPAREPGHGPLSIDPGQVTLPPATAADGRDEPYYATMTSIDDGRDLRLRVSRLSDGRVLVMGLSLRDVSDSTRRLAIIELVVASLALLASGLLGAILVRLGLRPLRDVERTALAIAAGGDLDRDVPGEDPDTEVGRLAASLNVMLGRIRDAFADRDTKERALAESEARMRRFVADVSHELRTPLAAVLAYAELVERGARDHPADLDRALRGISGEAGRMSQLVEELLLLARLDEGRPLQHLPTDLVEVVVESVAAARAVAPDWPVALHVDEVLTVNGDASRIRQVMDNLLANVRTHTPAGTTTSVRVFAEDGAATVLVADDGPGMSADAARRAFERFYRADPSRSRQSGGAGLGLSIVEAIVTAHRGRIVLDSAPGRGVRVTIHLPRVAGPAG